MAGFILVLGLLAAAVTALPVGLDDPVVLKLDPVRYHYMSGGAGEPYLVDLWGKVSDLQESARYSPDSENVYHLFTRTNPSTSQPIVMNDDTGLQETNFSAELGTVILIHGWMNNATSDVNAVLVPAFLEAKDVNVIVVDWSAGADTVNYLAAVLNTVTSGESVARFLNWLCTAAGVSPDTFHIVGHSLGGHQAGIVGRNLDSSAAYISGLDPAYPGWLENSARFDENDGAYTEVIHTNAGFLGYPDNLGQVDFYPNAGVAMPGCLTVTCDHSRSYFYMAESVVSGGFTGTECASSAEALLGACTLSGSLQMGGVEAKTGQTGIYYLETNSAPPFSVD